MCLARGVDPDLRLDLGARMPPDRPPSPEPVPQPEPPGPSRTGHAGSFLP